MQVVEIGEGLSHGGQYLGHDGQGHGQCWIGSESGGVWVRMDGAWTNIGRGLGRAGWGLGQCWARWQP